MRMRHYSGRRTLLRESMGISLSSANNLRVGDFVHLTIYENSTNGYSFLGWFENGILISTSTGYFVTAAVPRILEARFTQTPQPQQQFTPT